MEMFDRIKDINRHGKGARGRSELLKFLNGNRITPSQAIKAKCYECMGYYADGKIDCGIETCPLYPFMSYKSGGSQKTRKISEETREKLSKRMKITKMKMEKGSGKSKDSEENNFKKPKRRKNKQTHAE